MITEIDLKNAIRDIPDFPKKGIIFKDITTLLKDKIAFKAAIDTITEQYKDKSIDQVVCVEARGFIFGSAIAYNLGAGVIPVRKKGKLPAETLETCYALEYGTDTLQIHKDAIKKEDNILIIDDLLATGGTIQAVAGLVDRFKANIVAIAFLIELDFLKGREKLSGYPIFSVIKY